MHSSILFVISFLTLVSNVLGHGYLRSVAIDGKTYQGNVPNNPSVDSPIRLINDVDPVKGTNNPNLVCGQNAQNAALVVPANPGSKVTFAWANGGGGNWPHNTGPMLTYMASCEGTTCDKYDASGAKWFKIDEAGKKSDGSGWVQADLMSGGTYSVTLPDDIEPGDYLIRHEIIALQIALSLGGAEFYPSCTQVRVGGNGNGTPNDTVSFPGAYKDSDPGIFTPDVYNPGFTYVFPGPAIASFVTTGPAGGAASGNDESSSAAPTFTIPTPTASPSDVSTSAASTSTDVSPSESAAAPSSSPADSSGGCYDMPEYPAYGEYRPRRISRVMRNLD
ncbi:glycosyl hydrolase family 61-domain-containing protein [Earliella scabrosa]|nr:glycosyl hydrolase family 61-domain-containing protein [Earliella scabrosa]